MVLLTTPIDVDGELISWLPTNFFVADALASTYEVTGVKWTDGRPLRLRDRSATPANLKLPYGTVTYLHSYGGQVTHSRREMRETLLQRTDEVISGVAGKDTYQVRYRDIESIQSVSVNNTPVTGTTIVTTAAYYTPDAFKLTPAALALVSNGSTIKITYKYRAYDVGSLVEIFDVYRLEGKAAGVSWTSGTPRFLPAARVAKQWLDHMTLFFGANMQEQVGAHPNLKLEWAGTGENAAGLLPQEDETEARFVMDVCLYHRSRVFTKQQVRRVGTWAGVAIEVE